MWTCVNCAILFTFVTCYTVTWTYKVVIFSRGIISRLNSGIFKIPELSEWNLDLNSSGCRASKITSNDTVLKPIFWDLNIENPFLNLCVGVWVGGHWRSQNLSRNFLRIWIWVILASFSILVRRSQNSRNWT